MKIFISWSGERSRRIATALKEWLPDVFQGDQVFMSEHDIEAGSRWGNKLNTELEESHFGIVCLTPENLNAPWLLFEAGALSKAIKESHVVPYLLDLKKTDVAGPLAQFQGIIADEIGTFKLIQSINKVREQILLEEQLRKLFSKWWIDLKTLLDAIPLPENIKFTERPDRALMEEILQLLRNQSVTIDSAISYSNRRTPSSGRIEEYMKLNNEELLKRLQTYRERYNDTSSRGEEDVLEGFMMQIRDELAHRNLSYP